MKQEIRNFTYLLFFASKVLMIFNPGIFWDDWTIHNMDFRGIMSQFEGNGAIYFGYLHNFLQKLPYSVFIYHSLIFTFQFLTIIFLFKISEKWQFPKKDMPAIYFSILIYAVLPINDAALTMITLPYILSFFFFISATLFLLFDKENGGPLYRISSLILYFISFTTSSLLFFYILPFVFIIFKEELAYLNFQSGKKGKSILKMIFKKLLRYFDYLILPIVFWTIRSIFFAPSNHYKLNNYNKIEFDSLLIIPYRFFKFIYIFLASLKPLIFDLISQMEFILLFVILSLIIYKRIKKRFLDFHLGREKLVLIILLIFVGVFPYLLVNKLPSFSAYNSRHMLLLGFGISGLTTYIISKIHSFVFKRIIASLIIAGAVIFNVYIQFSYFKGYIKQSVLTDIFSLIETPKESTTILFNDATTGFTSKGSPKVFYEFSGISKTNNRENTLIIAEEEYNRLIEDGIFEILTPYFYQYNLSDYSLVEPSYIFTLKFSSKARPLVPLISYYKDFFLGRTQRWNLYFDYELSRYTQ